MGTTLAVEVPVTLRKQRAIVERDAPEGLGVDEANGRETDISIPR
ncbi:hypothetical protein [Microvirga sp. VF16]|nr:hypothetical protein [Microvirga sp. VF16]